MYLYAAQGGTLSGLRGGEFTDECGARCAKRGQ
jgi:hypothetical protein